MTRGPVAGHVLQLAGFIALTMLFQTLYFLADLYFVGTLGKEAVAGVSLSGNLAFVVLALTQSLGVGATALVAQALGRKQRDHAELVFNQALVLSTLTGLAFGVVAFAGREAYCGWLAADAATADQGIRYLTWFVPALVMQFPLVAMGAALRGMGDLKVPTAIQVATVLLNVVLAPILIFGWLGGRPLGVQGAALASLVAIAVGCRRVRRLLPARREPLPLPPLGLAPAAAAVGRAAQDRAACRRGVRAALLLHGPDLRHLAPLRRVGPGRVRHRPARDAVPVPPRGGDRVRHRSGRRPELRRAPGCAGARGVPRRRPDGRCRDAGAHGAVPHRTGCARTLLQQGRGRRGVRLRVPADRELELRGLGARVRDVERLPGPRQHAARARRARRCGCCSSRCPPTCWRSVRASRCDTSGISRSPRSRCRC